MAVVLVVCVACHKINIDAPIVGHWGCEDFVKCITDETTGATTWDTTHYEVGKGLGIEVFFNSDGTGRCSLTKALRCSQTLAANIRMMKFGIKSSSKLLYCCIF